MGEGQEAGGWCRFQDRAVAGCGHESGWQKWSGSESQLSGRPAGKTV